MLCIAFDQAEARGQNRPVTDVGRHREIRAAEHPISPMASAAGTSAHLRDVQSYVSETAPRLNMHRRTLQRILVKRTDSLVRREERSARRVDATRLTVWWAKYGRP
jgi:hypothetical protein